MFPADPAPGGAERYTVQLAGALGRRGLEVALLHAGSDLASGSSGDCLATETGEAYCRVELPAKGLTAARRYRRFCRSLGEHLASERYDAVHAMLPVPGCDLYHPHAGVAVEAARKWDAVLNPRRRAITRVERALLADPCGPLVLCSSDYVKRLVRQHYRLPDKRLVRLFNAVDLARFIPGEGRPPSHWVNALLIAQDYERKGLRHAIEALAKANDPRLRLLVVGDQDPAAYARLARELGVEERIVFHPPTVSPQEFYQQADFLVLPTRYDPCSLVVLEALAMGLPVISTVFNGACEAMADGTHGFILKDPADVATLADAMRTLCDDDHRREMSQACLALRPALAYEHHLDELIRIYERVAARPERNNVDRLGQRGCS